MHVVVGGASGFLGSALVSHLREQGHEVTRLVRGDDSRADASRWDPAAGRIDQVLIDRADAVVGLSGASIARWPRTKSYKRTLLDSRVQSTATLARAIARSPEPAAFLSGSAMGVYGQDRGAEELPETASAGDGFLADLVVAWEAAAAPATEAGSPTAFLRTSLVLDRDGGMVAPLERPFRLGLGARLGSGRQYMSILSREDWVRAVAFLLEHPEVTGPVNLAATAVTNAEFTDAFGRAVSKPTFLVAPSPALRLALGPLAGDLLGSVRVVPSVLTSAGFTFDHPDVDAVLASALA
ncbi:hypothetical protein ASD11_05030 [Aeromicrobium sp. Root495]|uniref:TIGR01777 family oxidoreductase n=1 Tax=Aeromicrobium sp. Root495 TaxID=1736550 RepID=UPI0006FF98D3|nr:TIGR01777 family oxidoreductase [Aeromicrobium sp. Root495]KQY58983.1 hypothetical protein ASD11_05030 [Aeromicrobium sp. Root495]RYJ06612.1 MAG: TIGR01777 family protein [Actinomycetales bacterium]